MGLRHSKIPYETRKDHHLGNQSIYATAQVVGFDVLQAANDFVGSVERHLSVNGLIHLLVGKPTYPAHERDSRITIERLQDDTWSLEVILGVALGSRTLGLPSFFGWLQPESENYGRRLVGNHKTIREVTTEGLLQALVQSVELITLYEQLFDSVRLTVLESSDSLSEPFAKDLRKVIRAHRTLDGFCKDKVRQNLAKQSGDWRLSMPNQAPNSNLHVTMETLIYRKTFALLATFDATGLPRALFYVENTGKKFGTYRVYRWNGRDFVPTNSELFVEFSAPSTFAPSHSFGPRYISEEMLGYFFPEVATRLGIHPSATRGDDD